jgi:hypothetical protein
MTYQGHIENGVIVLDESATLPDGAKVRVELLPSDEVPSDSKSKPLTFYERYKSIIGKAEGLPADFAAQHDHYIHGTPKRE